MEYLVNAAPQLSDALRSERKHKGFSQKEAAQLVGLLPKTISALETEAGKSSIDSLLKLLAALELEMVLRPKNSEITTPEGW